MQNLPYNTICNSRESPRFCAISKNTEPIVFFILPPFLEEKNKVCFANGWHYERKNHFYLNKKQVEKLLQNLREFVTHFQHWKINPTNCLLLVLVRVHCLRAFLVQSKLFCLWTNARCVTFKSEYISGDSKASHRYQRCAPNSSKLSIWVNINLEGFCFHLLYCFICERRRKKKTQGNKQQTIIKQKIN